MAIIISGASTTIGKAIKQFQCLSGFIITKLSRGRKKPVAVAFVK